MDAKRSHQVRCDESGPADFSNRCKWRYASDAIMAGMSVSMIWRMSFGNCEMTLRGMHRRHGHSDCLCFMSNRHRYRRNG